MKLITEYVEQDLEIICEAKKGGEKDGNQKSRTGESLFMLYLSLNC